MLATIHLYYSFLHVDVNIVDGVELNIDEFKKWKNGEFKCSIICEDGIYLHGGRTG